MSVLPYRLRKLIAVRPGVKTYEGTDLADESPVVIHHLHPSPSPSPSPSPTPTPTDRDERFERFADIADRVARVREPALPRLRFRTLRPEDPLYLVYDLPHGTGLDALLDQGGPLHWEAAVALALRLARPLAAAHAEGVAHLGLRPDRILLGNEGTPLLIDLGLTALLIADVPRPTPIKDTLWRSLFPHPELVAPELLEDGPRQNGIPIPDGGRAGSDFRSAGDARSDVHGLGMLLFHVTTLAWPYSSGTSLLVYNQVRAGVRATHLEQALGHVPDAVLELIRRATARDPAARHPDMAAVVRDLEALPVTEERREERLAALSHDLAAPPWTARFGEILTVVDGGRGRPEPPAEPGEPPPTEGLDPDQRAALEAERERQIRLAELTLERMRATRAPSRRRRLIGWLVAALVLFGLVFFLPGVIERSTRSFRTYEGGVDPKTGLTHGGPPARPPRQAAAGQSRRRPAVLSPDRRARLPIED